MFKEIFKSSKEMFGDIFSTKTSRLDKILFSALFINLLISFIILVRVSFQLINSISVTSTKIVVTTVDDKKIVSAYNTTALIPMGKMMIPVQTYHPEKKVIKFKINGKDSEFTVDNVFFNSINTGEKIEVEYGYGMLRNTCIPKKIRSVSKK